MNKDVASLDPGAVDEIIAGWKILWKILVRRVGCHDAEIFLILLKEKQYRPVKTNVALK